ncbi:MAG TPA: BatD family protein [Bacteroidales bacterium]|nr:BatD family protein [Bacteroidales bacterium]HPS16351.1 BatD family protein [Bacteroidales bacterium]
MKRYIQILLVLIISFASFETNAQKLTASCKYSKIALDKSFQVTYTLTDGSASQFSGPAFAGFTILGGPYSSSSSQVSIINGSVTSVVKTSWTYQLQPKAIGKYTIDAAKANVNGSWVSSDKISIEVTASTSTNATTSTNSNSNSKSSTSTTTSTDVSGSDIFIKAYADKTNPYEGEQVIITYKIYTLIPVLQYNIDKLPAFTGFWSEDITDKNAKITQSTEIINNKKYTVAEIRKVILFPEKSGALKIDPLNMECIVQVASKQQYRDPFADFFNDPFFSGSFNTYSQEKKTVTSNLLTINVKPLPTTNQPADFKNSVGSYTFSAELDKTKLKTNEAANLTFKIKGSGNLSLAELPEIDFPADFETYDPDIKDNIVATAAGVSGAKTFNYLIIPRSAGDFTIKPVKFCYFNLNTKSYVTLESPEFKLHVDKGSGSEEATVSNANKEDIKYLNSDIHYIKSTPVFLSKTGTFFYASPLFYGIIALPIILFLLFVIIYRKKLKENSNIALMRNKKATKVARKRLNTASILLKENKKEEFLDEVFKALWGYVSDKLNIPLSELSKETVNDKFVTKNVNEEISKQFIETLNNCEFARFAPDDGSITISTIYNDAIGIITKMEDELK